MRRCHLAGRGIPRALPLTGEADIIRERRESVTLSEIAIDWRPGQGENRRSTRWKAVDGSFRSCGN